MKNTKDNYIKYLEEKILELSKNENVDTEEDIKFKNLLKYQEEFLIKKFTDKDYLISENKRLVEENSNLLRTIMLDSSYINYLINSFWWKATIPFRKISRIIKNKKCIKETYVENITPDSKIVEIDKKVSVIIFTNNPGNEFSIQLDNLKNQMYIKELEIIVVDRGSKDATEKISKEYNTKFIELGNSKLTDEESYIKILPMIKGEYVVMLEQNIVVDSKYWIYQSIKPIVENRATITAFFKEDVSIIKNTSCYIDLKNRMAEIAGEQVLFLPENRDIIQYINPIILDKTSIIVKKKISNLLIL